MNSLKKAYRQRAVEILSENSSAETKYAYSLIAANVYAKMENDNARLISVAGVAEENGGSEVALNIAVQAAADKKNVLYVDCNIAHPVLSEVCDYTVAEPADFSCAPRFCEKLGCDAIFAEDIKHICQRGEGFTTKAVAELTSTVSGRYDLVIFDFPGIKENIPTATFSKQTDGLLLVVNKLMTKKKDLDSLLMSVSHIGMKIIGSVFINVK